MAVLPSFLPMQIKCLFKIFEATAVIPYFENCKDFLTSLYVGFWEHEGVFSADTLVFI